MSTETNETTQPMENDKKEKLDVRWGDDVAALRQAILPDEGLVRDQIIAMAEFLAWKRSKRKGNREGYNPIYSYVGSEDLFTSVKLFLNNAE